MKESIAVRARVVHVSSAHPYTDNRIHYREAVTLANAGFEVSLVAVESAVSGPASPVAVTTIPKRRRFARMLISPMQAVAKAVRSKAKIVHLHDPELIPYIPLLKGLGRTVVYDAHEDLPSQVLDKPYLSPRARRLLSVFAHVLVRISKWSDVTICATEAIESRHRGARTRIVRNYPPLREEDSAAGAVETSSKPRRLTYIGALGRARGLTEYVQAMHEPKMPDGWELVLAGMGSEAYLDELRSSPGWSRVDFRGQLPPNEARDVLLTVRVGLCVLPDTPAHREALPTKMFEYFAAGVPVIASDFPLWRTIVARFECGTLVTPGSPAEIAAAVRRYEDEPELLARHAANARQLAIEKLNWAAEGAALVRAYESVLA